MNGQWIGQYTSTNNGLLVLNLDKDGDEYAGEIFAFGNHVAVPSPPGTRSATGAPVYAPVPPVMGTVRIPKGQSSSTIRVHLDAVERGTGRVIPPAELQTVYPGTTAPSYVDAVLEPREERIDMRKVDALYLRWVSNFEEHGSAKLLRSATERDSELEPLPDVASWDQFKRWAIQLEPDRFIFRGQPVTSKLRTAFHRHDRASFLRFMANDLTTLHRHLTAFTTTYFNLADNLHYAAFLSLAQHHGYPTPLLDWTRSPFVAAYFAFRTLRPEQVVSDARVRILVFDGKFWNGKYERANVLVPAFNYISFLEPVAINNPRALPQQALSMLTNMDDIEAYVKMREKEAGQTVLRAIDLPASERTQVLTELDLMGINPGSMFPGLDGACAQVKDRYFGY